MKEKSSLPVSGCRVHNPGYYYTDRILPLAATYWVMLARRFLSAA
jgi:hippurate hydrolase